MARGDTKKRKEIEEEIRETLSRNVQYLMENSPDLKSQNELKRKAKVAQASIGRLINKVNGASVDTVAKIAGAYGVAPWLLLHPEMPTITPERVLQFNANMRALWERTNGIATETPESSAEPRPESTGSSRRRTPTARTPRKTIRSD